MDERRAAQEGLRSVFVGCGRRACGHARAYQHVHGIDVAGCYDIDAARSRRFAEEYDVGPPFPTLDALLRSARPNIVHVLTPPDVRHDVLRDIVAFGPDVILIEKPLAIRPQVGASLMEACSRAGVRLAVNHQLRHLAVVGRFVRAVRDVRDNVRVIRMSSRMPLLEHGSHLFDLVSAVYDDDLAFDDVLCQTSGIATHGQGVASMADSPAYAVGVATSRKLAMHVNFEFGAQAPPWATSGPDFHQAGVELIGESVVGGFALNRGWWVWSRGRQIEEYYDHNDASDDVAEGHLIDSVREMIYDAHRHARHLEVNARVFRVLMAAQRSSRHGQWVGANEVGHDAEIDELRMRDAA